MMKKLFIAVIMISLLLPGCSKPTEEEKAAKVFDSLKYKTYQKVSRVTIDKIVAEVQKKSPDVDGALAHTTMSLFLFMAQKGEMALIEAKLAEDAGASKKAVLCLNSLALYKMECPRLSKSKYEELKQILAAEQSATTAEIETQHKVLLTGMIAVGLYQGDADIAKFGAESLAAVSQLDYLPPLVKAVSEAQQGNITAAITQLRELNKSEQFSGHKKMIFAEVADIIENTPKEKIAQDLINRVVVKLINRVLKDIFASENKTEILNKLEGSLTESEEEPVEDGAAN